MPQGLHKDRCVRCPARSLEERLCRHHHLRQQIPVLHGIPDCVWEERLSTSAVPNASQWKLEPGVIYCDTSIGSREFESIIKRRHGLKVALKKLNSGDFAFRC